MYESNKDGYTTKLKAIWDVALRQAKNFSDYGHTRIDDALNCPRLPKNASQAI
jgi:hypothetical protein